MLVSSDLLIFISEKKHVLAECKQAQDRAISLINACNNEETVIIGNFRSALTEMEDEEDEDYDDDYAGQFDWLHDHDYDNEFY